VGFRGEDLALLAHEIVSCIAEILVLVVGAEDPYGKASLSSIVLKIVHQMLEGIILVGV
jgi:hypothetical protein